MLSRSQISFPSGGSTERLGYSVCSAIANMVSANSPHWATWAQIQ